MDRFTTQHCEGDRSFQDRFVKSAAVEMGDAIGHCLTSIGIPARDCSWAFATCLIQVMGKDAHNDNGQALRSANSFRKFKTGRGRWIHTRLDTKGAVPTSNFRGRPRGRFVWADSFDGANDILDCFGLTVGQVLDHFGNVDDLERMIFDLPTIVKALAPELLTATELKATG